MLALVRIVFLATACLFLIASPSAATDVKAVYKEALGEKEFNKVWKRAEQYRDLFLGNCFIAVRGASLSENERQISNWSKLENFNLNSGLELFNPKTSPDKLSIIDVSKDNGSCWTQLDSSVSPLSVVPILNDLLENDNLSFQIIDQKAEAGLNARTILLSSNDGLSPVIVHLRVQWTPMQNALVAIVRKTEQN